MCVTTYFFALLKRNKRKGTDLNCLKKLFKIKLQWRPVRVEAQATGRTAGQRPQRDGLTDGGNDRQGFCRVIICWHVKTHGRASLRSKKSVQKHVLRHICKTLSYSLLQSCYMEAVLILLETFTGRIPNAMPKKSVGLCFYRTAMPTACNIQSRRDLHSVKTYTLTGLTSLRDVPETRMAK